MESALRLAASAERAFEANSFPSPIALFALGSLLLVRVAAVEGGAGTAASAYGSLGHLERFARIYPFAQARLRFCKGCVEQVVAIAGGASGPVASAQKAWAESAKFAKSHHLKLDELLAKMATERSRGNMNAIRAIQREMEGCSAWGLAHGGNLISGESFTGDTEAQGKMDDGEAYSISKFALWGEGPGPGKWKL